MPADTLKNSNLRADATFNGWSVLERLKGDASTRRYSRVNKNGRSAILMDCRNEPSFKPGMAEFLKIQDWLKNIGISVPHIYEVDETKHFMIVEDFGDITFSQAIAQGHNQSDLYKCAAEVLAHIAKNACELSLPLYEQTFIHARHKDILEYYVPQKIGRKITEEEVQGYLSAWADVEKTLSSFTPSFLHMDYHLENIMFLPNRNGIAQCGIIDFQDGALGHVAYDLANLLEDARVSVPENIKATILRDKDEEYIAHYRVRATQFHCRVIGLFVKLAGEGKPEYLAHINRLENYIADALKAPLLAPLKEFFTDLCVFNK